MAESEERIEFVGLPTDLSVSALLTWLLALAPVVGALIFSYQLYKSITKCKDPEPDEKLSVQDLLSLALTHFRSSVPWPTLLALLCAPSILPSSLSFQCIEASALTR